MKKLNGHQTLISKPEIRFWIPIIVMIVSITIWGMALSSKLDIVAYRVEQMEYNLEKSITSADKLRSSMVDTLNDYSARIIKLEMRL